MVKVMLYKVNTVLKHRLLILAPETVHINFQKNIPIIGGCSRTRQKWSKCNCGQVSIST